MDPNGSLAEIYKNPSERAVLLLGRVFTARNLVSETQGHELLKAVARTWAGMMSPCNLVVAGSRGSTHVG